MTTLIEWLIGGAWQIVAPIIIAAFAGLGLYAKGRSDARIEDAAKDAKAAAQAHERMNHAPNLRDASDDDRAQWLRDFAERNRRP